MRKAGHRHNGMTHVRRSSHRPRHRKRPQHRHVLQVPHLARIVVQACHRLQRKFRRGAQLLHKQRGRVPAAQHQHRHTEPRLRSEIVVHHSAGQRQKQNGEHPRREEAAARLNIAALGQKERRREHQINDGSAADQPSQQFHRSNANSRIQTFRRKHDREERDRRPELGVYRRRPAIHQQPPGLRTEESRQRQSE